LFGKPKDNEEINIVTGKLLKPVLNHFSNKDNSLYRILHSRDTIHLFQYQ